MKRILPAVFIALFLVSPGQAEPYEPASPSYRLSFPRDHGTHPSFQTEWWYYVGHVKDAEGKRYGYQLTFFRVGLGRDIDNPSAFTARDLYFTHFAVSDLSAKKFWYGEKMNRPGPGLAGAAQGKLDVWNEDWRVWRDGPGHHLIAQGEPYGIDLQVLSPFAPVLHGIKGYSLKGSQPGNASLYYSFPCLSVAGNLRAGSQTKAVTGKGWMDHEFFSGSMDPSETGWVWFALQLDDNTELMLYLLRQKDGTFHPASAGTWVNGLGKGTHLRLADFQAQALETWKSPHSGAVYPVGWEIMVPSLRLKLQVKADLQDQELDTAKSTRVVYWEGSVGVQGTRDGKKVRGEGYLELTGVSKPFELPRP